MTFKMSMFVDKVSFEPMSGCWLWIGCSNRTHYGQIRVNGRIEYAHRFSWSLINGPIPDGFYIDHKCHNPYCVNPEHMRLASPQENAQNKNLNRNNTSGFKGSCWDKNKNKWMAHISPNGRLKHLGYFDTSEEAHQAYRVAAIKYFGSFANFGETA